MSAGGLWDTAGKLYSSVGARGRENNTDVRATCNPEPDSWVASLIEWYIDQEEFLPDGATPNPNYGFPIPERAGQLSYFTRDGETIAWGDSPDEVC